MHGMLSAAVMLAAFAVIAVAGGASAVWLYRASSGTPCRSRPDRPETRPTGESEAWPAGPEAQPDRPDGRPGLLADPAGTPDGPEPHDAEESVPADHSAGARLYVLGENRRPRR